MRSDDEVEHYSDLWLEVVVLDSLVEHIDASDIDESFSWKEFSARAAAMLPPSDAPPTEAELFAGATAEAMEVAELVEDSIAPNPSRRNAL